MCLGIPARIVAVGIDHPDLARVDMAGVQRSVNVGLLDDPAGLAEGDWILVHMGFALQLMTAQEADGAFRALDAERTAILAFDAARDGDSDAG